MFEWDEAKRRANLAKHGVDFADLVRFDWSTSTVALDTRRDNGEVRWFALGEIDGRVHYLAFARRGPDPGHQPAQGEPEGTEAMGKERKPERQLIWPSLEEDAAITAAAESDPDNPPLTDEQIDRMRPITDFPELAEILRKNGKLGRPPLPAAERKQRVTLHLDPDVLERLREGGKGWQTRANAALRKALGLD